jgi:hypothetical protein
MLVSIAPFFLDRLMGETDWYLVFCFQVFFEPKQWDFLVEQFKQEFCRLYGMTLEPLLNIFLQAGLSALKTPYPLLIDLLLACNCSSTHPHTRVCTHACTLSCLIHYKLWWQSASNNKKLEKMSLSLASLIQYVIFCASKALKKLRKWGFEFKLD